MSNGGNGKEGNGFETRTIQKLIPDSESHLLGITWLEFSGQMEGRALVKETRLEVPQGTQFVHVSLSSSYMTYGSREQSMPRELAAIGYDIEVKTDKDGKLDIRDGCCSIVFRAILQDRPLEEKTARWLGRFLLQAMCFGTK